MGTQSRSYSLFSMENSVSRLMLGATLLSSIGMNGCQPGRQASTKSFDSAEGLPWADSNSSTEAAWQSLQSAGIPAR